MTNWVDEDRAVDVVYLDFSKAFDTASCNILIGKPGHSRWGENWLKDRAEKVVSRGVEVSL